MQIPGLRGVAPGDLAKRSVKEFLPDDMTTYAAALAYDVLFALFPFAIFLIALLGALGIPGFFDWLLEQAWTAFPADAYRRVEEVVAQVRGRARGSLLSFGLVAALWAASSAMRSLMNALNAAYDVEESRSAWKRYPLQSRACSWGRGGSPRSAGSPGPIDGRARSGMNRAEGAICGRVNRG